jgi:hypothetical protein
MAISPPRYLRTFLFSTAGILAFIVFFNYWEDPFGIYHQGKSWDWIHSRPDINSFVALHKAYAVTRAKADVLFLGDSRVYNGLDPHFYALPGRAYNLATPGSRVYENYRYLQHAAAAHMPTTVVMGVDLRFFEPSDAVKNDFLEDRLSVQANGEPTPYRAFVDWGPTLLSTKALGASIRTLLAPSTPAITYDRGYEATWSQLDEHFNLVKRVLAFNAGVAGNAGPMSYLDKNGRSFSLDAFRKIVLFCAAHHIRLIVFVLPIHAAMLDAETADWKNYCAWMQTVLEVMESTPGLNGEFWDFAGYNKMSTETFTQPPQRYSQTVYYWETSHFKKVVGDLVLGRIFTAQNSPFGRRVTLATLPADEERLKMEKENWHVRGQLAPVTGE